MKIFNRESSISYIILSIYKNEKIKRKENSIKKLYHYVDAYFGSPVGGRSPTIWAINGLIEESLTLNGKNNEL